MRIDRPSRVTIRSLALMLVALVGLWLMVGAASAKTINGCVIKNHARCAGKDLAGANLVGAHLEYADLAHANLAGADLARADLRHADLTGAWLTGARLGGANLSGAMLTGVTSGEVTGVPKHLPTGWSLVHGYLLQRLARPAFALVPGPGWLEIAFTANPHASSYRARVCNRLGASCGPARRVQSGSVFTGLRGGTAYRIALMALGDGTHFSDSPVAYRTATPRATPLATPSFSLSPGASSLTLNPFSAVPHAVVYAAQLCDASGANCRTPVAVFAFAGTTFTGLTGGTTYTVKLTAIGDGTVYANSATVSETGTPGATQLATPAFTLTAGPGTLTINPFSAVPNASSYSAQRCDAAGNNCQAAVGLTTSGTTLAGLTGGTTYTIQLTAIGDGVVYADSIPASVTGTPNATPLATPNFTLTPGPSSVTLNFSAVPNATSYSADQCDASGSSCQPPVTVTPGSHSFTDLAATTTYTVTLTAIGDGTVYADSSTGSKTSTTGVLYLTPKATIAGAKTQLDRAEHAVVGPDGTLYVTNYDGASITSYAPGSTGNVTPMTEIVGSSTGLASGGIGPQGIGLDALGVLYVGQPNGTVLAFPSTASGNVAPTTSITGLGDATGIAFDTAGNLYVSQYPSGPIDVFNAAERDGPANPSRTIPGGIYGIATDASNNLYAVDYTGNAVDIYAAGTSNLIGTISGSNTGLTMPGGIKLDASGRIYVVNTDGSGIKISIFAPGANGNVAPIAVLAGLNAGVGDEGDIAIGPDGSVYYCTSTLNSVEIFAPLFAP